MDSKVLLDCIEWDTVNWSKALRFWETKIEIENKNFTCLELGGRRGGLSLWLALKGNNIVCSDIENPIEQASHIHRKHTYNGLITYEAIDATDIPYENHFDVVVFKSILGGISRGGNDHLSQVVIDQIFKALKPGGKLLFAENLRASVIHQFLRKKMVRWGDSWNYLDVSSLQQLLLKFDNVEYSTAGFLGAFGPSESERILFGKIDTLLFDWMLGEKFKYVVFGVATKPLKSKY